MFVGSDEQPARLLVFTSHTQYTVEPELKVTKNALDVHHICIKMIVNSCTSSANDVLKGINTEWQIQRGIARSKKEDKDRNRYNLVPHLTKDTNGKVTNSPLDISNESQEVSPFSACDHGASIKRRARKHNKHKTEIT